MNTDQTRLIEQVNADLAQGRGEAALAEIDAYLASRRPNALVLGHRSMALKQIGRNDEALEAVHLAINQEPRAIWLHHNLAGLLGDMGRASEAEAAAREAFRLGGDAPETWLVLGRALLGQNRIEEAEAALRHAVQRRPQYAEALNELAQLVWMRDGDKAAAVAVFDAAIALDGQAAMAVRTFKARMLDYLDDPTAAYQTLTSGPLDVVGHLTAAQIAMAQAPEVSVQHLKTIAKGEVGSAWPVRLTTAECMIAIGEPARALSVLMPMRAEKPLDQYLVALEATALRQSGDPRYHEIYDYDRATGVDTIQAPPGWGNLPDFLSDLASTLTGLHKLKTHPVGQSLRGGSQTTAPLARSDDPVIRAFFTAIDPVIRSHIERLRQAPELIRSRITGNYDFAGSWSVWLRPNGFHASHVHPQGWISSAFYVDVPAVSAGDDRQGWLKFGEPPPQLCTGLPAERFVQPRPGSLALFPSYMWHGTQPFSGPDRRMTIAFDVVPA